MNYEHMRRRDRQLGDEEARRVLEAGEYGILSTVGADGQPYGAPLSYAVADGCVWFHCARDGHKLRNIAHEKKVCFTVVGKTQPVYLGDYTTYFESAVVFGQAAPVDGDGEKIRALELICRKYLPEHMDKFDAAVKKSLQATAVWKITMEHITGKARR